MNAKKIRPIPKYLLAKIEKLDKKLCPDQKGHLRFYAYLTKMQSELVKVTVAARTFYGKWHCKQVAVHGTKSDKCLVRDLEYCCIGYGFRVGWHSEGYKNQTWYEDGKWYDVRFKYYNPQYTKIINPEFVGKFPEYKYSEYLAYSGPCLIKYLRCYAKYPQAEYLVKLGLVGLCEKVTILKHIGKDKNFCKWLAAHRNDLAFGFSYAGAVIKAYKTGRPVKQVQKFEEFKKTLRSNNSVHDLKELFGNTLEKFYAYIEKQNTDPSSYIDYLNACRYLRLNMNRRDNREPSNFKHWHDRRIQEYNEAKLRADKENRPELYEQFAAVAKKYSALQNNSGLYSVLIARSPAELIREGECLHHCVGQMNYEQKMAREQTLIFFIRAAEKPDIPFVTVEYSPSMKKVLQCYGYDSKPNEVVSNFVNQVWLPYANRTIKKEKIA
jgi:hypothetical protein